MKYEDNTYHEQRDQHCESNNNKNAIGIASFLELVQKELVILRSGSLFPQRNLSDSSEPFQIGFEGYL